jgi:hypothetical protein
MTVGTKCQVYNEEKLVSTMDFIHRYTSFFTWLQLKRPQTLLTIV